MRKRFAGFRRHIQAAHRSGLERTIAASLALANVPATFEQHRLPFEQPAKRRHYTPDFVLPNGIVIETKGLFAAEDREKMLLVITQHPHLDIRMVFSNAKAKLRKGSSTTYASWCDKNGIRWAHKTIPAEWLVEKPLRKRLDAIAPYERTA